MLDMLLLPYPLALLPLLPMHRLFAGKRDQEPKRGNLIFAALSREEESEGRSKEEGRTVDPFIGGAE